MAQQDAYAPGMNAVWDSAALIERLAIGDEGDDRTRSIAAIIRGGADAIEAARHARIAACDQLVAVDAAIKFLRLDA